MLFALEAELVVLAEFDWSTLPLFESALRIEIGTLTFFCSELASLDADWLVELLLVAVWVCFTTLPSRPTWVAARERGARGSHERADARGHGDA